MTWALCSAGKSDHSQRPLGGGAPAARERSRDPSSVLLLFAVSRRFEEQQATCVNGIEISM